MACGQRMLFGLLLVALLSPLEQLCPLGAKIDEGPELAVEQVKQEAVLEAKFADYKAKYGVGDRRTLEVFFELFDLWIMLYRLNKADNALKEVVPACEWRHDDLSIKAVQALAFTRWKQGKYKEALSRFHQMEGWLGKNAALCENIGHTYNAIGALEEAETYFQQAAELVEYSKDAASGDTNKGGILLGLAGTRERQDKLPEALKSAQASYVYYKARDRERGWDSSLTAKAAMMVSKVLLRLGDYAEAERKTKEAVRLFISTSGEDSPLLSGAYKRLGEILVKRNSLKKARTAFHNAYKLEAIKDAFDLTEIVVIHQQLTDCHIGQGGGLDRAAFKKYFDTLDKVLHRVRTEQTQDGNAGVYYKSAGETYVLGGDCQVGKKLLEEAIGLLKVETSVDTTNMVRQCEDLVRYCDGTHAAQQT